MFCQKPMSWSNFRINWEYFKQKRRKEIAENIFKIIALVPDMASLSQTNSTRPSAVIYKLPQAVELFSALFIF
jgi:hypothetical protein